MQKAAATAIIIGLMVWYTFAPSAHAQSLRSQRTMIFVPDDFRTIQEAINMAGSGERIFVKAGIYRENVLVDKPVFLIGEDKFNTIIDGSKLGTVIEVTASNVSIENFTVRGSGYSVENSGIDLSSAQNCTINGNVLTENSHVGIMVSQSVGNALTRNIIAESQYGIVLVESSRDTVSENDVEKASTYGIALQQSSNCQVTENNVTNSYEGIVLLSSNANFVSRNTVTNGTSKGIRLDDPSDYNTFTENTLTNNAEYGFWMWYSSHNRFYHNLCDNTNNVLVLSAPTQGYNSTNTWDNGYPSGGNYWSDYKGDDLYSGPNQNEIRSDGIGDTAYVIDAENTDHYPLMHPWSSLPVQDINTGMGYETIQEAINANETLDGHRIFVKAGTYYENVIVTKAISLIGESEDTTIVDGMTVGSVIELSAHNVTITGFTIRNSGPGWAQSGIALNHFGNCNVSCNRIANNTYGMWLESSLDNTISRNDFANDGYGIGLYGSSNRNTILENDVTSSSHAAILLASSSDNDISKNNITDSEYSVELVTSSNNTITANYVSNNSHGLALYESSNDNYVVGNTIRSNGWGFETDTSIDNRIYHNNFIDNTPQVYFYMSGYPNIWDADYPEGGNYWSDQNRTDFGNGPSQNETGSDGIADAPYLIDSNNGDHYPLMGMFYDFEVYPPNLTGTIARVELISNSSVSNLYYLAWVNPSTQYLQHDQLFIVFSVEEENGTAGFCRLTIPRTVLNASTYTILVNWNPVNVAQFLMTNSTTVYLYFTYTGPKQEIVVTIPEFPLTMTLAVAIVTTSASALLSKRRLKHRTESTI